MGNAAPRAQLQADSASQYRTYLMAYSPREMNLIFGSLIGDGKFLKTIYCKSDEGGVIVKIYRKHDPNESLSNVEYALRRLSSAFSVESQPNLLPYADYKLNTKFDVAYLVRQYFASNLYDRICSRPFLTTIEKKWIAFQILRALEQCHAKGICHGDIKQENIMVTSWNWIFLTDFAPFKPTYIPEDDPADYNYYFCAIDATRRGCSVAPERFYGKTPTGTSAANRKKGAASAAATGTATGASKDAVMLSKLTDSELTVEEIERQMLAMDTNGGAAAAANTGIPTGGGGTSKRDNPGQARNRREGNLLESMDVFSAGCVITELFLGGKPLFDLPSLLKYRTGDSDHLKAALRKVDDPQLEELLLHMLQLDPRSRLSASEYLLKYTGSSSTALFPSHFGTFLSRFMVLVLGRGGRIPDARVRLVAKYYGRIVREVAGVDDYDGEQFFKLRLREGYGSDRQLSADLLSLEKDGHVAQRVLGELDQRMPLTTTNGDDAAGTGGTSMEHEKEKEMSLSRSAQKKKIERLNEQFQALTEKKKHTLLNDVPLLEDHSERGTSIAAESHDANEFPLEDDDALMSPAAANGTNGATAPAALASAGRTPESQYSNLTNPSVNDQPRRRTRSSASATSRRQERLWQEDRNGIVIVLSLLCSSLRHVQVPESKITALYLMRSLSQYTTDEVQLQRLVPFLIEVLDDSSATVRALAIKTMTFILSLIKSFPLSDASIFPLYLLPQMAKFPVDPDELVRITFAECLPLLASTSRRFLEIAHSMKQRNSSNPNSTASASGATTPASSGPSAAAAAATNVLFLASSNFDKELNRLHKMVSRFVIQLAAPDQKSSSSLVKRALLGDITRLCIFFGRERTLDVVLPQLITFLNDRDWELRGAFFDHITGVGAFVGRVTVELYILPCIEQALFDVQEIVITKALDCLSALCQLGLFQKSTSALADKAKMTCSLLLHPSWWIRDSVLQLMSYISVQMGSVDANVFLAPLLRPFLKKTMVFLVSEKENEILKRLRDCSRAFVSRERFDAALIASSSSASGDSTTNGNEPFETEGFLALTAPTETDQSSSDPRRGKAPLRGVLSSVDSLDNYSITSHRLPPPPSPQLAIENGNSQAAFAVEQAKKNEQQSLKLMHQYVQIASMHMRSKMELLHSEQSERMRGDGGSVGSAVRKLPRSALHVLYVPDMRFALSVAQPIRGGNLVMAPPPPPAQAPSQPYSTTTALVSAAGPGGGDGGGSRQRQLTIQGASRHLTGQSTAALLENLSLSLIVRMYGLVAPNLPLAALPMAPLPSNGSPFDTNDSSTHGGAMSSQQQPMIDINHFNSGAGAVVSILNMNLRDIYGGGGDGGDFSNIQMSPTRQRQLLLKKVAHPVFRESSTDPALANSRKLLGRLTALGVPPLPPDLGALRLADGSVYSIYAHPSSPYSMLQSNGGGGAGTANSMAGIGGGLDPRSGLMHSPSSGASAGSPGAFYGSAGGPNSSGSRSHLGGGGNASTTPTFSAYRNWRPRKNVLVAELAEHSGAVNRIASSQDFSFLASASNDGTVKLWSIRSLQHSINQGSRATYDGQGGVLTDMVVLDNSHSVASASSNGTVHVFRVDKVHAAGANFHTTGVREVRCEKSAVTVLDHLNNVTESLLIYATRNGAIHAWDLRARREAWKLEISPELGYVTCITHSLDVSWLAAGTSRGFICLWDLRFLVLIRIWRHSSHRSIHRLKPCLGLPNTLTLEETSVPLVFVAAGDAEVAVFDLSIGACRAIFRTLHVQAAEADACRCPTLLHVPIPHRSRNVLGSFLGIYGIATAFDEIATTPLSEEPSVRAILCPSLHFRGVADALITGGEDKQIRYWDVRSGKQSFTVCGDGESKSFYDNQSAPSDWWRMSMSTGPGGSGSSSASGGERSDALVSAASMGSSHGHAATSSYSSHGGVSKPEIAWSKLSAPIITICQDASYYATQGGLGAVLAAGGGVESAVTMERRGLVPPSPAHNDCILDLALVDLNGPVLVSSGRDGIIKAWK